jgi:multicomponent Na+:H+ antiporter subunit G
MTILETVSLVLILVGCCFFIAGSVGMLRFPDAYCRLHATTKSDNVGLGLVVGGLLFQVDSGWTAAKLVVIWLLMILSAATACQLIARAARQSGVRPWEKRSEES